MKETTKPTTTNKHKYTKKAATDSVPPGKTNEPRKLSKLGFCQIAVSLLLSPKTPTCKNQYVARSNKKAKNRTNM